jgi:hypothetical protein
MVDLAIVPSFGDNEVESKAYRQVDSETVETQVMDDAPFQASLGINSQKGNWTISASYDTWHRRRRPSRQRVHAPRPLRFKRG